MNSLPTDDPITVSLLANDSLVLHDQHATGSLTDEIIYHEELTAVRIAVKTVATELGVPGAFSVWKPAMARDGIFSIYRPLVQLD